jgi:hypothetical protein
MTEDDDFRKQILLDLNGLKDTNPKGYRVEFEAREVGTSKHRPHGLKYSITLHDRMGNRLIGYDNAHSVKKPTRKRYGARKIIAWDHKHRDPKDKGMPYEFDTVSELLSDFWNDVDTITGGW